MGRTVANFKTRFSENISSKSEQLTKDFKVFADRSGWTPDLYSDITISASGMSLPDSAKVKIQDREYGGPEAPPNAVMRKFKPTIKQGLNTAAEAAVLESLVEKAGSLFKI
jgi:hypothetical protein